MAHIPGHGSFRRFGRLSDNPNNFPFPTSTPTATPIPIKPEPIELVDDDEFNDFLDRYRSFLLDSIKGLINFKTPQREIDFRITTNKGAISAQRGQAQQALTRKFASQGIQRSGAALAASAAVEESSIEQFSVAVRQILNDAAEQERIIRLAGTQLGVQLHGQLTQEKLFNLNRDLQIQLANQKVQAAWLMMKSDQKFRADLQELYLEAQRRMNEDTANAGLWGEVFQSLAIIAGIVIGGAIGGPAGAAAGAGAGSAVGG